MVKPVVFDIETQNSFQDVGKYDPALLKISVVGVYDYSTDRYAVFEEKELVKLWPILENASELIGFNINHFDLPVLKQYYLGDIAQFKTLDLLVDVEKALGYRLSLDDLVRETLNVTKTGYGLLAIQYFQEGKMQELKDYCVKDVELTKKLYEYGRDHGEIFFKSYAGGRQAVKVNWGEKRTNKTQVNLTMPW